MFQKNKSLIDNWLDFRSESLAELTTEDKEHNFDFDNIVEDILITIPDEQKETISNKLDKLVDTLIDFSNYYNDKYYKAGFYDMLSLINGGKSDEIR